DGSSWVYTPADVNSISQLNYTYESTITLFPINPALVLTHRLARLGAAPAPEAAAPEVDMDMGDKSELVGANKGPVALKTSGARATVKLDSKAQKKVTRSLSKASHTALPDRTYLQLENVRGNFDANKLDVSVNQQHVGTVALFGLRRASLKDSAHGGEGL